MKRKAISKLIGAGLTVAFLALVRPSTAPTMGVTAVIAIVFYELNQAALRDLFPKKQYHTAFYTGNLPEYDLSGWANTKVGP